MKKILRKMRGHKQLTALILIILTGIVLNIISWTSSGFSDWYAGHIFPLWVNTYGRLTSLVPISVGEVLIIFGVVFLLFTVLILLPVLMLAFVKHRKKIGRIYLFTYGWIFAFILTVQTLNCFILYHCSTFGEVYDIPTSEHTDAQLIEVAEVLIERTNELSFDVKRDDEGHFVLTADLDETAKEALRNLSDEFPRLGGYYVTPKKIKNSFFMSQQYLMGIYFPFTMEANYNQEMYECNLPETVTHELVHTKGFIFEDEANFIAFLACARSDNKDYNYSGYLNTLKYVLGKVGEYCGEEKEDELYEKVNENVWLDITGNKKYWQDVQESDEGLFDSKEVAEISDKAMETSLKINGVEDGKRSYGRMVDLLLGYYYSNGKKV